MCTNPACRHGPVNAWLKAHAHNVAEKELLRRQILVVERSLELDEQKRVQDSFYSTEGIQEDDTSTNEDISFRFGGITPGSQSLMSKQDAVEPNMNDELFKNISKAKHASSALRSVLSSTPGIRSLKSSRICVQAVKITSETGAVTELVTTDFSNPSGTTFKEFVMDESARPKHVFESFIAFSFLAFLLWTTITILAFR